MAKIIFGSVVALPLSLSNYSLSHQKGMSLNYSKTAPPLAIFDDERIPSFIDEFVFDSTKRVSLKATKVLKQRKKTAAMANQVAKKFASLQAANAPIKVRVRHLAGLSITKKSSEILQATFKDPSIDHKVKFVPVTQSRSAEASHNKAFVKKKEFVNNLRPTLRARVEAAEGFDEVLNQNFIPKVETFEQRAKNVLSQSGYVFPKKDKQHQEAQAPENTRRTYAQRVITQQASPVTDQNHHNSRNEIARRFANSGYARGLTPPKANGANDFQEPPIDAKDELVTDKAIGDTHDKSIATVVKATQGLISGPIEISGGLAFTNNNQHIVVYRQIAGTKYEFGQVLIQEGRYEIYIEDLSTGIVVAELIDNGDMIGRAEISIPEVVMHAKGKDLSEAPLEIKPVVDRVIVDTISEYNVFTKKKSKLESKVLIADSLPHARPLLNSTIIMKATADDHWGNISVGSTRSPFLNILTPASTVKALIEILGVTIPPQIMGIIRGEVSVLGKKVAGAQVELMGNTSAQPVYFNSFIPDPALTQTSSNGEFAFVGLTPGSYLIRAKYNNKYLSPVLVPVESGYITRANFEVQNPSISEAFVYNIQTSEMMSANLGFIGSDQVVPVHARKLISFSGSDGVQFLEAISDDPNFYISRVTTDKSEKEILVPMVPRLWLSHLLSRFKINRVPDTGIIIGTAPNLPYAVELDQSGYNSETQVIYFDQQGQAVPGAMVTPAGGGFVIVNVNSGFRSLATRYYGTENIKISTVVVDSSAINLFPSKL